jgi:hypothetical protein
MSATILAAKIVSEWEQLSQDSPINRETYLRNLLLQFQHNTVQATIEFITEDIKP